MILFKRTHLAGDITQKGNENKKHKMLPICYQSARWAPLVKSDILKGFISISIRERLTNSHPHSPKTHNPLHKRYIHKTCHDNKIMSMKSSTSIFFHMGRKKKYMKTLSMTLNRLQVQKALN